MILTHNSCGVLHYWSLQFCMNRQLKYLDMYQMGGGSIITLWVRLVWHSQKRREDLILRINKVIFPEGIYDSCVFKGKEVTQVGSINTFSAPWDVIPLHLRGGYIIPTQVPANTTYYRFVCEGFFSFIKRTDKTHVSDSRWQRSRRCINFMLSFSVAKILWVCL